MATSDDIDRLTVLPDLAAAGSPPGGLGSAPAVAAAGATALDVSVLHVVEALLGGPASYLEEILPEQSARLGAGRIGLIIPREEQENLPGHDAFRSTYFSSRRPRLLNVLRLMVAIRTRLRREPVDVIHAQGTFAGVAVRLAVRGMARPPRIVYCAHGWAFDRRTQAWKNRVAAGVERLLAGWADAIVCISTHEYDAARRIGIPPERLFRIISGIHDLPPAPAARSAADPQPVWPTGTRRFAFVGRFDQQKGLDRFLAAMAELGPAAHGYAVGRPFVQSATRFSFPANVEQTGWLSRHAVQAYIRSADVVVMPSRWEGFGLTAIEAMRAGKPVIATRVGGLAEIVDHEVSGLLVEQDDREGLAAAMRSMTDARVAAMGQAGRARFLRHFQAERMNRSLLDLYRQMKSG